MKKLLRHPHERPPKQVVRVDQPPSWWVTAAREGFSDRCEAEATERMRHSKAGMLLRLQILDV